MLAFELFPVLVGVVCLTVIVLLLIGVLLFAESKLVNKGLCKIEINGPVLDLWAVKPDGEIIDQVTIVKNVSVNAEPLPAPGGPRTDGEHRDQHERSAAKC